MSYEQSAKQERPQIPPASRPIEVRHEGVLNAIGRGFDYENVDIAAPIGHEVLVDVQASGLCHPRGCHSETKRGKP